jgi:hypothetical protein
VQVSAKFIVNPLLGPLLDKFVFAETQPLVQTRVIADTSCPTWTGFPPGVSFEAVFKTSADKNKLRFVPRENALYVEHAVSDVPLGTFTPAWGDLVVNWKLKLFGNSGFAPETSMGASNNPAYVLWKKPPANLPLYETLVRLSTKAAANLWLQGGLLTEAQIEAQIPREVFTALETKNVKRSDGAVLKYYGQWTTVNATTLGLLRDKDGQCTAWANFFVDLLKVQGLTTLLDLPFAVIRSKNWNGRAHDEWFLVNDWTFYGNPDRTYSKNKISYKWQNIMDPGDTLPTLGASFAANRYLFSDTYTIPNTTTKVPEVDGNNTAPNQMRTGLAGQGNNRPVSMFNNHVIVVINNILYDPSYGAKYDRTIQNGTPDQDLRARLDDLEATAIAGYAVQEDNILVTLNNNIVRRNVLYISKREGVGGLVIKDYRRTIP